MTLGGSQLCPWGVTTITLSDPPPPVVYLLTFPDLGRVLVEVTDDLIVDDARGVHSPDKVEVVPLRDAVVVDHVRKGVL